MGKGTAWWQHSTMYNVITQLVVPDHKRMCCALYHILPWKKGSVLKKETCLKLECVQVLRFHNRQALRTDWVIYTFRICIVMDVVSRLDVWKKCPEILRIIHAAPAFWGLQCGIWWYLPKDLSISCTADRKFHISETMNESKTKEIHWRKFCLLIKIYFNFSFLHAVSWRWSLHI